MRNSVSDRTMTEKRQAGEIFASVISRSDDGYGHVNRRSRLPSYLKVGNYSQVWHVSINMPKPRPTERR